MSAAEDSIDRILHAHSNGSNDRVHKPSSASPTNSNPHHAPGISNASAASNPRSCVTCRKRKVKCDKRHPCTNCTRGRVECIFPSPGRAPRRARKPQDVELLERLRKLEGVVQQLGGSANEASTTQPQPDDEESTGAQEPEPEPPRNEPPPDPSSHNGGRLYPKGQADLPPDDTTTTGIEARFGRLVVDEGRSRYINSSFWASLNNEVEDIKGLLLQASDDEDDFPSPGTSSSNSHQGYIFGYSSVNVDMLSLHPPPEQFAMIWDMYKENVDPLVKVLHIPTTEPKILKAMEHRDHIPKGMEALLFAIYYAVITSMATEDCQNHFGADKQTLLAKYRFGLEQGLARANFLQTDEWIVLQAFVIFLICLRRNEDARIIWTLTGLVVRMAQTLGIHRDGSHFNLSPFEIEMRRRLWWQVCILDARASEDHGCDPTIVEATFDTLMPLNLNDADLDPSMTEFPKERFGCTEMTFCLVRFEVANVYRRIQYVPPGPVRCSRYFSTVSLEQKEKWITEVHTRIEERYLKHCDMTVPLYWVIATVSRLIMSKMWLMLYHPYQRLDGGASLPQETKDKLFVTSLENVEYSLLLETEERTQRWGWLFRTYVQWHAIAFLLSELCIRTRGELVDRSWRAVESTAVRRWSDLTSDQKKGCLWRPLRRLVSKARAARQQAIAEDRGQAQAQAFSQAPTTNAGFCAGSLASSTTSNHFPQLPLGLDLSSGSPFSPMASIPSTYKGTSGLDMAAPPVSNVLAENIMNSTAVPGSTNTLDSTMTMPALPPTTSSSLPFDVRSLDWLLKDTDTGSNTSPPLDTQEDPLDWANWDDMVAQYAMEVEPQEPQEFLPLNGFQSWY